MAGEPQLQRISRFTSIHDVLTHIDAQVGPVAPVTVDVAAAIGRVLAGDVVTEARPPAAVALRDGWAVISELTSDASSYAPIQLPAATRVDVGEPLPPGTDAVAPLDVVLDLNGRMHIIAPLAAGEGVLPAGADADPQTALVTAGERLTGIQATVLAAVQVRQVAIRWPGVRLARARPAQNPMIDAACALLAGGITAAGGRLLDEGAGISALEDALTDETAAVVIAIGGTGNGRRDNAVEMLARAGRVEAHGVALSPGETVAFGFAGPRPVLLIPGRLDAALAVWLVIGRHILARLSGSIEVQVTTPVTLARKVASPLGFMEVVPVRCTGARAEPIASGYWPLHVIARADGWILVPADSEGFPAGAEVMVRPWP
jgi:molybdopterin molybdotransferase